MQSAQVQQIQHQIPAGASVILKMSELPTIGESLGALPVNSKVKTIEYLLSCVRSAFIDLEILLNLRSCSH